MLCIPIVNITTNVIISQLSNTLREEIYVVVYLFFMYWPLCSLKHGGDFLLTIIACRKQKPYIYVCMYVCMYVYIYVSMLLHKQVSY